MLTRRFSGVIFVQAQEEVRAAVDRHGEHVVATTSFGNQSKIILQLIRDIAPQTKVMFTVQSDLSEVEKDRITQFLQDFQDMNLHVGVADYVSQGSKGFLSDLRQAHSHITLHDYRIEDLRPDYLRYLDQDALDDLIDHGVMIPEEERNNPGYKFESPETNAVKIAMVEELLVDLQAEAWISGIRNAQTPNRKAKEPVMRARGGFQHYNVIVGWDDADARAYIASLSSDQEQVVTVSRGNRTECGMHVDDLIRFPRVLKRWKTHDAMMRAVSGEAKPALEVD